LIKQYRILSKYKNYLRGHQIAAIRDLSEGNDVCIVTKTGSDKSLAYECLPLVRASRLDLILPDYIQLNRLARAFEFAVRYIKGEEKVSMCTGSKSQVNEDGVQCPRMFQINEVVEICLN